LLSGCLTVTLILQAAGLSTPTPTPEAFVQRIFEIAKKEPSDSQQLGKILGLTFVKEQLTSDPGIAHMRYTPTEYPPPFNAVPQSFDYRVATRTETSLSFADLGFRLNVENFCVTRETIESVLGSGKISPPPLDSGSRGGFRESDVYGVVYSLSRPTKTVRLIFDFEWRKCLQRVLIRETASEEK